MTYKTFVDSLPFENCYYSQIETIKYIASQFGSIFNIYKIFIDIIIEYNNEVLYYMLRKVFNTCNIKFKKPKSDICETCDGIECEISKAKRQKNTNLLIDLENRLKNDKVEANLFYEIKRKTKQQNEFISDTNTLCNDLQKNLQIPKTNVSIEYYLSKFYLYSLTRLMATRMIAIPVNSNSFPKHGSVLWALNV